MGALDLNDHDTTPRVECRTILVVDDNPTVRLTYAHFLTPQDSPAVCGSEPPNSHAPLPAYHLLQAESGEAALELVRVELNAGRQIAVGFFELCLPGMDGLETMRQIRAIMPNLLCTVVTGDPRFALEDIAQLFADGVEDELDYINKPFSENEIRQKARSAVRSWNRRRGEEDRRQTLVAVGEQLEERVRERTKELNEACRMLAGKAERLQNTLEQLQTTRSQLARSEQLAVVGRLASMVAHEINNPAAYVLSNLEIISSVADLMGEYVAKAPNTTAEEMQRWDERHHFSDTLNELPEIAADCLDGIRRIAQIVRDLKGFARVGSTNVEPVSIVDVVSRSVSIVRNQVRFTATLDVDVSELPQTVGHSNRLVQVLINLLLNAQQAFPDSSSPQDGNRIRIRGRTTDGEIELTVADNGPGISAADLPRIFEPFFTTKEFGVGSGLGLSVCKSIVDEHKGQIGVHSTEGEETTFWLRLPILSSSMLSVLRDKRPLHEPRRPDQEPAGQVLLIDDDSQVIRALSRGLRRHYAVDIAADGRAALAQLKSHPADHYDVVLCDIMMPGMSGIEVYSQARLLRPGVSERFIFITGGLFSQEGPAFLSSGVRWLEKPVALNTINDCIAKLMRGELAETRGQLNQ